MTQPRCDRVIFVDDDADVRMAIGQSLELAGYRVTACRAFIEATDHLVPGFAGVVVTDVRMPGKDGFDMLARVHKVDPDIPVIVLTGEGDVAMAVRAMTAGAFDFLEKPCPVAQLLERVAAAQIQRTEALKTRRNAVRTLAQGAGQASLSSRLDMVERLMIEEALAAHDGHVIATAEALGLPRKTLYDKLKRHALDPAQFRREP